MESPAEDRVTLARERALPVLQQRFRDARLEYPAHALFLLGLKREKQLELWARDRADQRYTLVHRYPVLGASGGPGPKRREGDLQVPEGFYWIDRMNPRSRFHLSLGINYPNASDLVRGDREKPGFDIFIHGGTLSVGCLAMGDPAIEEIFLAVEDSITRPVPVHLYPARMDGGGWAAWADAEARRAHAGFWQELEKGWALFARHRIPPIATVTSEGAYRLRAGR